MPLPVAHANRRLSSISEAAPIYFCPEIGEIESPSLALPILVFPDQDFNMESIQGQPFVSLDVAE
jgi:hypothetical protein